MKNINSKIIGIIIVCLISGFALGMFYQQKKSVNSNQATQNRQFAGGNFNRNGQQSLRGQGNSQRPVGGEIIASDDKTLTVKLTDGSSKIVFLNDKTTYNKSDLTTKDEAKVGAKVMIFGTANTDGSVTAQSVQLNPIERRMMGMVTPTGEQIAK